MKMTRVISAVFTAAVLAAFFGVTLFAAETTLSANDMRNEFGVYAKCVDKSAWNIIVVDSRGNGSVSLPDGTEFTVSGADESKGRLVIDMIGDEEVQVLDWINGIVEGKAKNIQAFHVYYLDDDNNIKDADGVKVTMKTNNTFSNPIVCSLKNNGDMDELLAEVKDSGVTVTSNGAQYYIIGEKVTESDTTPGGAPQTGENTVGVLLTIFVPVISAAVVLVLKRRSANSALQ